MHSLKFIFVVLMVLFVFSACTKMDIGSGNTPGDTGEIVFGELGQYEIFENRIIVGYENREAVDRIIELLNAEVLKEIPKINAVSLKIPCSVEEAYSRTKAVKDRLQGIKYIEPSYVRYLIEPIKERAIDEMILRKVGVNVTAEEGSNDEYYEFQWALQMIGANLAWDKATGSGVVVAVVDTPIDGKHPDLEGRFVTGYDPGDATHTATEIPPNTDYEDPLNPDDDHGTHVAGIIAAIKDNGEGIVGLAYNAKIMPILIFRGKDNHDGRYYVGDEYVADAIIWAVDHGADVLSNSWGGPGYSQTLKNAIDYALKNNVVFVAAAGNDHAYQHWFYPSAYPGVIGVAASTAGDEIAYFSSRGDYVSVAAPGVNIISCIPVGSASSDGVYGRPYAYWSGTSMATPYVSALAALIKEKYPNTTPYQIRKMIEDSAMDIDEPGYDYASGYGRINADYALDKDPGFYGSSTKLVVKVYGHTGSFPVARAYVSLTRETGVNYYAKTDDNGEAVFYSIDADTYNLYIGGPDWTDPGAPNLRLEEELATSGVVDVMLNSTETVTFKFRSTFAVDMWASPTSFYIAKLIGSDGHVATSVAFTSALKGFSLPDTESGKFFITVERSSTGGTATIEATVTINGYTVEASGTLGLDATLTYIDENGGVTKFWWIIF